MSPLGYHPIRNSITIFLFNLQADARSGGRDGLQQGLQEGLRVRQGRVHQEAGTRGTRKGWVHQEAGTRDTRKGWVQQEAGARGKLGVWDHQEGKVRVLYIQRMFSTGTLLGRYMFYIQKETLVFWKYTYTHTICVYCVMYIYI